MKKLLALFIAICASLCANANPNADAVDVVRRFGNELSQWCRDGKSASHLDAIESLTSGEDNCYISDKFTEYFQYDESGDGSKLLSSFLTAFKKNIKKGMYFSLSNIRIATDYDDVKGKKDTPPVYVQADVEYSGSLNLKSTNIFYVRKGKIIQIVDYSSKTAEASRNYKRRNNEAAFRLYRELAYESFTNFEAQYKTALMEIYKTGCKNVMSDEIRDMEAYLFTLRICAFCTDYELKEKAANLLVAYSMSATPDELTALMACFRPLDSDRLLVYDSRTQKYGYKNQYGRLVIPYKFKKAYPFNNGRACIVTDNGKICYIDPSGNVVTSMYDSGNYAFFKGRNFCINNGTAYLIDDKDKRLKILSGNYRSNYTVLGKYACLQRYDGGVDVYTFSGDEVFVGENLKLYTNVEQHCYILKNAYGEEMKKFNAEW
ncbi:MAG: WG repeat-containing protein [Bacteroidales bacterium]|nr:WG repeat-containing protein [Bacteroidales bacterium]